VKDRDQIVDEIIVRMTPWQFETRCTHNTVHFVLNEQQRRNPFWNQPATLTLLGKGPKFIPKARPLTSKEVLGACARLNYRMVRAFERFIRRDRYEHMKALQRECGIQDWFPKQRSLTTEYCRTYVKGFFRCSDAYGPWGGNQLLSPYFDRSISNIERDIIAVATAAKKSLSARHRWPNITKVEQSVIMQMRELDVGYNSS